MDLRFHSWRVRLGFILAGCLLTGSFLAVPAGGQTVSGVLLDEGSLAPVPGAAVQFLDEEGELAAATVTDGEGRFELGAPGPGAYQIVASRLGYGVGESDLVELAEGQVLQVNLFLPPSPVMLEGFEVEGEARPWRVEQPPVLWPFFERAEMNQRLGLGRIMTREDLEGLSGRIRDLWPVQILYRGLQTRSFMSFERPCREPVYYVDGMRVNANRNTIDDFVMIWDLEGAEVYRRASEIPAIFGGSDAHCGVVALWTRRVP